MPPPEWRSKAGNEGKIWKMNCTIFGLQGALSDFDAHFDGVVQRKKASEDGETMYMKRQRHLADPASWSGMGAYMGKHVDDGILVGTDAALDEVEGALQKHFKLKLSGNLLKGCGTNFLEDTLLESRAVSRRSV